MTPTEITAPTSSRHRLRQVGLASGSAAPELNLDNETVTFGRWQTVLLDALRVSPVIGVALAVEAYLDRTPTRAEITAARRAATSLEDAGLARRHIVPIAGRTGGAALVLSKRSVHPDDAVLRRATTTLDPRLLKPMRAVKPAVLLAQLVDDTTGAAARARWADPYAVPAGRAAQLAEDLQVALNDLARLRRQLESRSQEEDSP